MLFMPSLLQLQITVALAVVIHVLPPVSIALAVALLCAGWTTPLAAQPADPWQDERAVFEQAWAQAGRGNIAALEKALAQIPNYPLAPYLRFEWLRQRIAEAAPDEVLGFLAAHRDWSFADQLEQAWLDHLAAAGRDELLLRHGERARRIATRCRLERARLARGQIEGLEDRIRSLWLAPQSQPRDCDPLFSWWRSRGHPDADTAWQRFGLAMDAGETRLAGYLKRYLPGTEQALADGWIEIGQRPVAGLTRARSWPDRERARRIAAWGLYRLAARDWSRAADLHDALAARLSFTEDEIGPARRRIALFQAVDLDPGAIERTDALGGPWIDEQMLEWRARVALANGRWDAVLDSIARMPESLHTKSKWRYWRARALAELGRDEDARTVFANLARQADYHGFLAALRLGRPLSLCSRELAVDGALQRRLYALPEFVRALELRRAGLAWHARWTWQHHVAALEPALQEQAALAAASIGWYDRTITTLAAIGALDAYPWRFPLLERERIIAESARHRVDPAFVLGLMRAESAMQPDARSHAGARGLMQLLDRTARAVARRHRVRYGGPSDLDQPELNIALGIAHLGDLHARFDGSWPRVAAAYNAGIAATERWLSERPNLPTDVWIETLSFHETRDYIQRVLAFATIYEWQLGRAPALLADSLLDGTSATFAFACAGG